MKTTTVLAIALGVGALAACNEGAREEQADNIEASAENTADAMEANAQNAADEVRAEGENAADATREGADADGNSAN